MIPQEAPGAGTADVQYSMSTPQDPDDSQGRNPPSPATDNSSNLAGMMGMNANANAVNMNMGGAGFADGSVDPNGLNSGMNTMLMNNVMQQQQQQQQDMNTMNPQVLQMMMMNQGMIAPPMMGGQMGMNAQQGMTMNHPVVSGNNNVAGMGGNFNNAASSAIGGGGGGNAMMYGVDPPASSSDRGGGSTIGTRVAAACMRAADGAYAAIATQQTSSSSQPQPWRSRSIVAPASQSQSQPPSSSSYSKYAKEGQWQQLVAYAREGQWKQLVIVALRGKYARGVLAILSLLVVARLSSSSGRREGEGDDDGAYRGKDASYLRDNSAMYGAHGGGGGGSSRKPSCERILDELDDRNDQRRKPRLKNRDRGWTGKFLFDLYEPEATCFSEERFGSESEERFDAFGDGPKFICGVDIVAAKAEAEGCLVYSVGSNNDIRFEKAVHTHMHGCEIITFDPTLEPEDFIGGEYATFYPWGLGTDGGKEGKTMKGRSNFGIRKSFETVMKDLGHEHRTIDILKIDCEGCEYAAMPPFFDLISSGKASVNQVLIELHVPWHDNSTGVDGRSQILYDFFRAADRAKFRLTHKERNHWGCEGSRCVEFAFVNERFLRDANGAIICPAVGDNNCD